MPPPVSSSEKADIWADSLEGSVWEVPAGEKDPPHDVTTKNLTVMLWDQIVQSVAMFQAPSLTPLLSL